MAYLGFAVAFFAGLIGGFTFSTSAISSLNGSGIWGIGLEFVIFFGSGFTVPYLPTPNLAAGRRPSFPAQWKSGAGSLFWRLSAPLLFRTDGIC